MIVDIYSHLQARHMDINLHRPIVDTEKCVATYLLYNLSGQIVGYQQYNPNGDRGVFNSKEHGRYYTYRKSPTVTVWGLESLPLSDGVIYLTEGIYDAARMTARGHSALATLCNNPPRDYANWLRMLGRPIVAVCDNDPAGRKLAKYGHYVETVPNGKDLGDAPNEYIEYLLDKYTLVR